MNLVKYEGRKVEIIDNKNQKWEGIVTDLFYPEDNEPERESIVIKCEKGRFVGNYVEFFMDDIKSIKALQK
jgi:hypothetical protein